MTEARRVIVLNGASSSGKSSLAKAMQEILPEPFLHVSSDHLVASGMLPARRDDHGPFAWQRVRPRFFARFHRCLPACLRWTQSRRPWMLALVDMSPSGDGDGPPAVPAVYRGTEGRPGPVLFTLDVDGERFAIRRAGDGGTAYDWLSGPNEGYGFGSSGTPNRPVKEHRESIRAFLAMIDPNTGYIGDD